VNDLYDADKVGTFLLLDNLDLSQFTEINIEDSERLLDKLDLIPHHWPTKLSPELFKLKDELILDILQRSPKIDLLRYLEEKGYYKQADDPAIPQGP